MISWHDLYRDFTEPSHTPHETEIRILKGRAGERARGGKGGGGEKSSSPGGDEGGSHLRIFLRGLAPKQRRCLEIFDAHLTDLPSKFQAPILNLP